MLQFYGRCHFSTVVQYFVVMWTVVLQAVKFFRMPVRFTVHYIGVMMLQSSTVRLFQSTAHVCVALFRCSCADQSIHCTRVTITKAVSKAFLRQQRFVDAPCLLSQEINSAVLFVEVSYFQGC